MEIRIQDWIWAENSREIRIAKVATRHTNPSACCQCDRIHTATVSLGCVLSRLLNPSSASVYFPFGQHFQKAMSACLAGVFVLGQGHGLKKRPTLRLACSIASEASTSAASRRATRAVFGSPCASDAIFAARAAAVAADAAATDADSSASLASCAKQWKNVIDLN